MPPSARQQRERNTYIVANISIAQAKQTSTSASSWFEGLAVLLQEPGHVEYAISKYTCASYFWLRSQLFCNCKVAIEHYLNVTEEAWNDQ